MRESLGAIMAALSMAAIASENRPIVAWTSAKRTKMLLLREFLATKSVKIY